MPYKSFNDSDNSDNLDKIKNAINEKMEKFIRDISFKISKELSNKYIDYDFRGVVNSKLDVMEGLIKANIKNIDNKNKDEMAVKIREKVKEIIDKELNAGT